MSALFANKKLVASCALLFLGFYLYLQSVSATTSSYRLILWTGMAFAALIVFRRQAPLNAAEPAGDVLAGCAVAGALAAVAGIVANVHQFEWLGVLLLAYAALRWSLPEHYAGNVGAALFVLYWALPLPGNLFGAVRLALQKLSVTGAEWALHLLNLPAWADGLLLRTGGRLFEVPEACSGMNTAMIVVVCALGSGSLLHLSIVQRLVLLGAGFVQVLLLNAARIALMVAASWDKPPEWSDRFLHDSTAALLLLMIVLIQCEAALWNWCVPRMARWRDLRSAQHAEGHVFGQRHNVPLPHFDKILVVLPIVLAVAALLFAADRRRPYHRGRMIASVAEELALRDPEQAERAARVAAALRPGDLDTELLVARIQLIRGRHEQALATLQRLQPIPEDERVVQLMAWALLGSRDLAGARQLLARLPPALSAHPGIAMCATELAIMQNDDAQAASNVVIAARWPVLTARLRQTYPFLARRGRWEAIAATHNAVPYRDPDTLRTMLVALTTDGHSDAAVDLLDRHRPLWFGNPVFLPHLQSVALRDPERTTWVQYYMDSLAACMDRLSAEELTAGFEPCFVLGRPDLSWIAYRKLAAMDPTHPILSLVAGRFAANWFVFRGGALGVTSPIPSLFDMRPYFTALAHYRPYADLLPQVPHAAAMLAGLSPEERSARIESGLAELARREPRGTLTYEDYVLQETCLSALGRTNDAFGALDRMESRFPDRRIEVLSRRARLYRELERWQALYETLRAIRLLRPCLERPMQLTMADAMSRIEMGVCAVELCDEAVRRRPKDRSGWLRQAALWNRFGYTEEALFALRDPANWVPDEALASLLRRGGRYAQSSSMYTLLGRGREAAYRPTALPALPAAENVLEWPTTGSLATAFPIAELDRQIRSDESPFLRDLHRLTREWILPPRTPAPALSHAAAGGSAAAGAGRAAPRQQADDCVARWRAAGRDVAEQVVALHRLAFLAAGSADTSLAQQALDRALELMPSARLLWRMRIALSGGDPGVVAAARNACPTDPEIWLADLVLEVRRRDPGAAAALRVACTGNAYSPGTLVRAGHALLRAGDPSSALLAARYAEAQSRDWIPPCTLGLDAALATNDVHAAVSYALRLGDLAPDPVPFFRLAVRLGMGTTENQRSLTRALDVLVAREPDNPEWALRQGALYFKEGFVDLAHQAFGRWLTAPPAGAEAGVLIMMAESARHARDLPRSIALLREALRRYPSDIHVVNSLAYTLAQAPGTAMEARSFLPRLAAAAPTASILDTIAVVRMRSGETEAVRQASREALSKLRSDDPHWREIHLNAAEIECVLGNADAAAKLLREARRQAQPKGSPVDMRMAELETRVLRMKDESSRPHPR